ncbi:MAG: tetratricopeptide repeat protein, partial [Eubacteriales bacterium]
NVGYEKEISLTKALVILVAIIAALLVIGTFVGNKFFWNKFDSTQNKADITMKNAEMLVKQKPKDAIAYAVLGIEYLKRGKTDEAIENLEKAHKMNDKHLGIMFNLGLAYKTANKNDKALAEFSDVLKRERYHFLAIVNTADIYVQEKQFDKALPYLATALQLQPGAADVWLLQAQAYAGADKKDLALKSVDKALKFVPDYKEALELKEKLSGK